MTLRWVLGTLAILAQGALLVGCSDPADEPEESYEMTIDGTITQSGTMAVQPSATTALLMQSDSMSLHGDVYDPPRDFDEDDCLVDVAQNGNDLSGMFCGREAGVDLGGFQN